jgi:hypothetical protein
VRDFGAELLHRLALEAVGHSFGDDHREPNVVEPEDDGPSACRGGRILPCSFLARSSAVISPSSFAVEEREGGPFPLSVTAARLHQIRPRFTLLVLLCGLALTAVGGRGPGVLCSR